MYFTFASLVIKIYFVLLHKKVNKAKNENIDYKKRLKL